MPEDIYGLSQKKERVRPFSSLCLWLIGSLLLVSIAGNAQNLRCRTIPSGQSILLDSLPIEKASISVKGDFTWDEKENSIRVTSPIDSLEVCYRVVSDLLSEPLKNRDMATYDAAISLEDRRTPKANPVLERQELFDFGGIQRYGAISRGVSFGNRQSLFVNSTLNLQMDGKLDENLFISAVITDQNIPYQPEGNTQQIRDFDNVFIKLYNDQFDVSVGDILLKQPENNGYFLRYLKNIQGIQATYRAGNEDWQSVTRVSGALSKGKFNSANIQPIDGLSGPYRLRGPEGERFIIVLANSEKVFLDGKLLQRGFDKDYVIDYNLGELTFNNHLVITQFSVIRVDFEYAEQFYSRSNISAYQEISTKNTRFYANYYREKDNPNTTLGFSPTETELDVLQSIGDDLDQAFITNFDTTLFAENRILYEKKDTVTQAGDPVEIFQFSNDRNKELFAPTFSEVGAGNGDYVLTSGSSNGRIYEWISPVGEARQGNYTPGALITLPNQRQLMTVGSEVKLSPYETVSAEVAFSQTDQNLYSSLDDADNVSRAYQLSVQSDKRSFFLPGYHWMSSVQMEYDEESFSFIDRYRPILFDRDWNYQADPDELSSDFILQMKAGIFKDERNQVMISSSRRKKGQVIDGWQQDLILNQRYGHLQLYSRHFLQHNQQPGRQTDWIRSKTDLSYRKWKMAPGYIFEIDQNAVSVGDSVQSSLMHFTAQEFYLASTDSARSTYRFSYRRRQDQLPQNGELREYLHSDNFAASYAYSGDKGSLQADLNYRKVDDLLGLNLVQEEVINGRINWVQSFLDKSLRSNFSFATGNSRELRREFIYLPVATGEGTHTWRDTNEDGIQDLNEFFEAINPDERNYVKIFTPTDDYITSFQTFYQHTIDAQFPRSWTSHGGVRSLAARFSANVNYNIDFKTTNESFNNRLNPFILTFSDDDLIAARDNKRYTLFYNRNKRGLAGDLSFQTFDTKQLLVQGFELREKEEWIHNAKMDVGEEYTLRLTTTIGSTSNRSDFLESRNFEIESRTYRPQFIWQPGQNLRMIGSFERKIRFNEFSESSDESSKISNYTAELTWNKTGAGSVRGSVSFLQIDFTGDPTSYLGYILLDALQPGSNQTWQLNWQQQLSKGLQLSLLYNGRKSEEQPAIHTGSVQVTAFF